MRVRIALFFAVLQLLASFPAIGIAQSSGPFAPLPPPQTAPIEPEESQQDDPNTIQDDTTSRTPLYIAMAVVFVLFVVIGYWVVRDARRSIPREHRDTRQFHLSDPATNRKQRAAKKQSRKRARAARRSRRQNR